MLVVKKFGGKTLATPEKIHAVADHIAQEYKSGKKLIITASAMGQTTDDLLKLAHQVSPHPNKRELDMLLTTGERVSMALVSMALIDRGCPAISFTGSQAGILTSSEFSQAKIIDLKPIRVQEALDQNKIVVLAGFQGVDPVTKEITTLGRGGSDTTAIVMGAHLKASVVQILKDVDGICTADPKIVPEAYRLEEVTYEQLVDMCFWGAQFLHFDGALVAREKKVPLFIGSAENPNQGTWVKTNPANKKVFSVNSFKKVETDSEIYKKIKPNEENISTVSVTTDDISGLEKKIITQLKAAKIEIFFTDSTEFTVTVGVRASDRESAIRICHSLSKT